MNTLAAPKEYKLSKFSTYYIFTLLFLLYFFDYVDRMIVTSLFPYIQKEWGLTDTQSGLLVSVVYWSIVAFVFPVSILVDRWSRKKTIAIMALIWSLATALCAFTKSFPQLLMARSGIGIGEAGYAPAGTAMLSGLFPPEKRSRMMGLWNMSIPLGMAAGIVAGGFIATHWGWKNAFGIVALPGLLIAILFFFVKDYKTVELEQTVKQEATEPGISQAKKKMTKMDIVRAFSRTPSLLLTYLGFAGMMFLAISLSSFLPTYFQRVHGAPSQQANLLTSGIMLMAIIGSPLGGWIADRWMRKRIQARLLVPAISALLTAVLYLCGLHLFSGAAVEYPILILAGIASMAFASSAIAVTQDVVHPGLRAISYALCVIAQNLLGSSLGPIVTGALSDAYGIATALKLAAFAALVSCVLFYLGSKFYKRDLDKVERVTLTAEK